MVESELHRIDAAVREMLSMSLTEKIDVLNTMHIERTWKYETGLNPIELYKTLSKQHIMIARTILMQFTQEELDKVHVALPMYTLKPGYTVLYQPLC